MFCCGIRKKGEGDAAPAAPQPDNNTFPDPPFLTILFTSHRGPDTRNYGNFHMFTKEMNGLGLDYQVYVIDHVFSILRNAWADVLKHASAQTVDLV